MGERKNYLGLEKHVLWGEELYTLGPVKYTVESRPLILIHLSYLEKTFKLSTDLFMECRAFF